MCDDMLATLRTGLDRSLGADGRSLRSEDELRHVIACFLFSALPLSSAQNMLPLW